MPYEYRRMTPEEREEVLHIRRDLGYPLHAPPHPFRQGGQYLISASNYEHALVMASPGRRTEFEQRLLTALVSWSDQLYAWVILPNHYHILLDIEKLDLLSAALKQLHGTTSRDWNMADHRTGERTVWYKYSDRLIRDEAHFRRALNYIHLNPVKHGWVEDPFAWPWTSLHNYAEEYGPGWLSEQLKLYPTGNLGKGWDD